MRITFLSVCGFLFASQQVLAQTDSVTTTHKLKEVVVKVTNGMKSKRRVDNTDIIGQGQLIRAACCNLGESFTANPSVDDQKVTIVYDSKKANYDDFVAAFKKIGYEIKKK